MDRDSETSPAPAGHVFPRLADYEPPASPVPELAAADPQANAKTFRHDVKGALGPMCYVEHVLRSKGAITPEEQDELARMLHECVGHVVHVVERVRVLPPQPQPTPPTPPPARSTRPPPLATAAG